MPKALPIGRDDFKEVIEEDLYYVDKTSIIEGLLSKKKYVTLFPRPRRFGKSLFISMLDNFFNIEYKDINKNLFEGLNISNSEYYQQLSTRPVIKLDFKVLKKDSYEQMYNSFKEIIRELYSKKKFLLEVIDYDEVDLFNRFLSKTASRDEYEKCVYLLSNYMYRYYDIKPIILIDEYDVPIERGYINNYYDDAVSLIKDVFSSALKSNNNISFAVMTGVLRVSKESLFSDLNNVDVYNMNDKEYNEYFGFTIDETKKLLEFYNLELNEDVKDMYDGYNFGGVEIYNPWSIIKYADRRVLEPFWVNTSGNELIIKTVSDCKTNVKILIEKLLLGETVEFEYNDKTTYQDYNDLADSDSIFNLLLASGYLTIEKEYLDDFGEEITLVKLPNKEVRYFFKKMIVEIIKNDYNIDNSKIKNFCIAVLNNNKEKMEEILNKMLPNMSYHDTNESGYHNYILGIFSLFLNDDKFIVRSNRESGIGRFDLMIKDKYFNKGIIIEFKITKNDMEESALKAINQIEEKEYYLDLINEGYKDINKFAIVFRDKSCIVR